MEELQIVICEPLASGLRAAQAEDWPHHHIAFDAFIADLLTEGLLNIGWVRCGGCGMWVDINNTTTVTWSGDDITENFCQECYEKAKEEYEYDRTGMGNTAEICD